MMEEEEDAGKNNDLLPAKRTRTEVATQVQLDSEEEAIAASFRSRGSGPQEEDGNLGDSDTERRLQDDQSDPGDADMDHNMNDRAEEAEQGDRRRSFAHNGVCFPIPSP